MLHEGGAGVAAESYGQYSGHPGVAIVTSGPGSTNILTAVAAAFTDSTPMIVLAGQVKTEDLTPDLEVGSSASSTCPWLRWSSPSRMRV